jgi:hypothetical protein
MEAERRLVDSVADTLTKLGFDASPQDTGGGILCVVLRRRDGGEIIWGTADFNWEHRLSMYTGTS